MTMVSGGGCVARRMPDLRVRSEQRMSRDRNTPALYEVFGRASQAPVRPHAVEVAPVFKPPRVQVESIAPEPSPLPAGPVSPRLIRLPVGYVYVGLAAVVLLIVGSYFVGVSRGKAQALAGSGGEDPPPLINDPTLQTNRGAAGTVPDPRTGSPEGREAAGASRSSEPQPAPTGRRVLDRDTRRSGLNYVVVERFDPAEAWAVKEFLKRNGIDVLVLADNNPALLQVVTAEGFQGWASNTAAQALDKRLGDLGRQWKAREGGSKDFSKRLPQLQK